MPESAAPLVEVLVYLGAAALVVPVFKRIGLGAVLGYLAAGLAIGPWGAGLIEGAESVARVSELGIVLLFFLVGLDLEPSRLWALRRAIFGMGGTQLAGTIVLAAALGWLAWPPFGGPDWGPAVVLGVAVAMSSTPIAVQVLGERGLMDTEAGRSAFAVSLFQDLAVIPLLLVIAALAPPGAAQAGFGWDRLALALGLIALMVLAGRVLLRPVLRWIAGTGMREIFVAFALLLIVGSALTMQSVGLSMALGAFIAGVLLADSEYRMELVVDIEPFKGLLLGLFFMAVGLAIDVGLVLAQPLAVLLLAVAAVALKLAVLLALARAFGLTKELGWVFAISISGVGEFAFVVLTQAQADRILDPALVGLLNAVVAVSMLTTPLLMIVFDRVIAPRYRRIGPREADPIDERNRVIVCGLGRFGQIIARLLLSRGVDVTSVDHDPNQIEQLRRFGWRVYYGDARRPDVLEAAGLAQARLVVLAMDDPRAVVDTARWVRSQHPGITVVARARSRGEAFELEPLHVTAVRETFGSALEAAQAALVALGEHPYAARSAAHRFRAHDERMLAEQARHRDDEARLIDLVQRGRRDLERLLADEQREAPPPDGTHRW